MILVLDLADLGCEKYLCSPLACSLYFKPLHVDTLYQIYLITKILCPDFSQIVNYKMHLIQAFEFTSVLYPIILLFHCFIYVITNIQVI